MKIRYLGHSCVEILGKHHILIDPDFSRPPLPNVEFICVSHAHKDHIGQIASISSGVVLASPDVCEIAHKMGIPTSRLKPVKAGEQVENIKILPGFSVVKDPMYIAVSLLFRFRLPDPGGTPLSFLIQDEADLLHVGDAHQFPIELRPDILCLPWRNSPIRTEKYKSVLIEMAKQVAAPYILPIHYDLPGTEADPAEITHRIHSIVLSGERWHVFSEKKEIEEN
jgi:L-ascorbate metabolism protein UlaG (beta-lactamase superfamily)